MKYRYCKNLLDSSMNCISSGTPGNLSLAIPASITAKSAFRSWCANPVTTHCFYSACEGVNVNARIGDDNPVHTIHGLVVDYDSHGTVADACATFLSKCPDNPPSWVSQTFSKNIRVVWEFKTPVLVAPELARHFLSELAGVLKAKSAFAGLDATSFNPAQVFEAGTGWARPDPANPALVPDDIVQTVLFKVIGKHGSALKTDQAIPISVVAEEVFRKFPGRWKGDFIVGARGPLFWVNDGVDRVGCQVGDFGMICYSDRAGKPFVPWVEILGKAFVADFETKRVSTVANEYWFDHNANRYYTRRSGKFVPVAKEDMFIELKAAGFSAKVPKGKTLTEIEEALRFIRTNRYVDGVAPVLFAKGDTISVNGQVLLNSSTVQVLQPHPTDGDPRTTWPWLHSFLSNWFDPKPGPTGHMPLDYLLAWLKRFYTGAVSGNPVSGQALIIVGPTDRGKTLLSNKVIGGLMGGVTEATDFLMKRTAFNKQLSEVGVWAVDDAESTTNAAGLRLYTEMLKKYAANPWVDARAMYRDAQRVPWFGRIMISANEDANSLSAIPALDQSNRDKLMCFKLAETRTVSFPDNRTLENIIRTELPHFARWLLDWDPPKEILAAPKRYGVVSYFHPSVEAAARDNSPNSHVIELVELFVHRYREANPASSHWYGNVTELAAQMNAMSGLMHMLGSRDTMRLQRGLDTLVERSRNDTSSRTVKSLSTGSGKVYMVSLDDTFDFDVSTLLDAQWVKNGNGDSDDSADDAETEVD